MIIFLNCENAVEGTSHCAGLVSQNAMVIFTKHSEKYSTQGFKDYKKELNVSPSEKIESSRGNLKFID